MRVTRYAYKKWPRVGKRLAHNPAGCLISAVSSNVESGASGNHHSVQLYRGTPLIHPCRLLFGIHAKDVPVKVYCALATSFDIVIASIKLDGSLKSFKLLAAVEFS